MMGAMRELGVCDGCRYVQIPDDRQRDAESNVSAAQLDSHVLELAERADPTGLLRVIPVERAVDKNAEGKQDDGANERRRGMAPRPHRFPNSRSAIANQLQVGAYHKVPISDKTFPDHPATGLSFRPVRPSHWAARAKVS